MKILFSLPNFFNYFEINNKFAILLRSNTDFLKNPNIKFTSFHGNFSYNYWNGDINLNYGKGSFYKDFIKCGDCSYLPLRFNMSNVLLQKEDFYNVMNNLILTYNNNGSNEIELCNLELMDYIKEKHPLYTHFIFSRNGDLINPMTPEIINKLILTEAFDLISLPERYNYDFEELQKISNKGKIELTVNPICNPFCPYFSLCLGEENNNQYNFSSKSAFSHCAKRKPYLQASAISLAEIEEKYLPLGINHFKISPMTQKETLDNVDNYLMFLIKYFIKEERQMEFYELFKNSEGVFYGS